MNPSHRLSKLNRAAQKRISRLRARVSHYSLAASPERDVAVAWATIEALNLWMGFLRAYYLSGAIQSRTQAGRRVIFTSTAFADTQRALEYAIRVTKDPKFHKHVISRRDEPTWHSMHDFLRLVKNVGASNLSQIYAALAPGKLFQLSTHCAKLFRTSVR